MKNKSCDQGTYRYTYTVVWLSRYVHIASKVGPGYTIYGWASALKVSLHNFIGIVFLISFAQVQTQACSPTTLARTCIFCLNAVHFPCMSPMYHMQHAFKVCTFHKLFGLVCSGTGYGILFSFTLLDATLYEIILMG